MLGLDVLLGGITGLIGNVATTVMNLKTLKEKNKHEEKMVALNSEAMKLKAEMNIAIKKAEIDGAVEIVDSDAYMEGIKQGNQKMFSEEWINRLFSVEGWMKFISIPAGIFIALAFGFVEWLRGFMRPAITAYLIVISTFITWQAWDIMQQHGIPTMTSTDAIDVYNRVTSIIVYLTVSCVTWWFADRRSGKFLQDMYQNQNQNKN